MERYWEFTEALERQLQLWEFWHTDQGAAWANIHAKIMREGKTEAAPSLSDYVRSQIHTLENADPYYVSHPICNLLESSLDSLPDVPLGNLPIPSVAGWVYFASPRTISSDLNEVMSGFTWHVEARLPPSSFPELKQATKGFMNGDTPLDGAFITFYKEVNGILIPVSPMYWPFEDNWGSDWRSQKGGDEGYAVLSRAHAYVFAFFAFIVQRLAATTITRASRATRRRLKQANFPAEGLIKIVTLRAKESSKASHESTPVDWSCQWIVRAHWRNQPYPSLGIYKPKLIPSHVKGPEDKPLKKPATPLFAVVR